MEYEEIKLVYENNQNNDDAKVFTRHSGENYADIDLLYLLLGMSIPQHVWDNLIPGDDQTTPNLRCVKDFFILRDFWMPTEPNTPILYLSQCEILNCVRGAEWLLTSEVFVPERADSEEFEQRGDLIVRRNPFIEKYKEFLYLIKMRLHYITSRPMNAEVMNASERYVQIVKNKNTDADDDVENAYESDGFRVKKKFKLDMMEDLLPKKAICTNDFIFEVNRMLCGIDTCLKKFETRMYVDIPSEAKTWTDKLKVDALRRHVFEGCATINERNTVSLYKTYYHDMVCTESYKEVYRYFYPHNKKCTSTAVLVKKAVVLIEENLVSSFPDIINRVDYQETGDRIYRFNTDFLFFRWSEQFVNEDVAQVAKRHFIERDPVRVCWSLSFQQQYYKSNSFFSAFALLRVLMRYYKCSPIVENVDLSKFDNFLF